MLTMVLHIPFMISCSIFIHKACRNIVEERKIEEVIIAIESSEHESIRRIINEIEDENVLIKIIPDMYDILRELFV